VTHLVHPLDGARLKVIWAKQHLDAFKEQSGLFLDTKPYSFVSEIHPSHWWVKPHLTIDPPRELGLMVGDCITNIRAALDYVIWEMASKHFTIPIDLTRQGDRGVLTFPVLLPDPNRRQGHIDHLDRLAKRGFPSDAISIIKDAQADVAQDASLQWLSELVNTDKHRTPILTVGIFSAAQIEVTNFLGRDLMIRGGAVASGIAIKTEPELAALFDFVRQNPMNVNVQAAVHITSKDVAVPSEPLDKTLGQIVETVANIVPRFDRFFV
jgi:hypothetical protein